LLYVGFGLALVCSIQARDNALRCLLRLVWFGWVWLHFGYTTASTPYLLDGKDSRCDYVEGVNPVSRQWA
jgi:hypothetical protein